MGDVSREQQIRERAANATPGPWFRYSRDFREHRSHSVKSLGGAGSVVSFEGYGPDGGSCYMNSEFIAHARTDVPWLLLELEDARAEIARLSAVAEAASRWAADFGAVPDEAYYSRAEIDLYRAVEVADRARGEGVER